MNFKTRFTKDHISTWVKEGGVLIKSFFTDEEIDDVKKDFERIFGSHQVRAKKEALTEKENNVIGKSNEKQFLNFDNIPVDCSKSLNLIGLHPALISFAKGALKAKYVHLYQCQIWAKYTGEADYDQAFHCDFANHTLTVPSKKNILNSVTILIYFSDVTEEHGPMHYVPRSKSIKVCEPKILKEYDTRLQEKLKDLSSSSASPAGSIFAYGIDVYHRGTNMTKPNGYRYAIMACYKKSGNDSIGYSSWPWHHKKPWEIIFNNATPEQLSCLGIPPPGNNFWNEDTIRRNQLRWPEWDMTEYKKWLY